MHSPLLPLNKEGLEDFILENSPRIRKLVALADKARRAGEVMSLEEYQRRLRLSPPPADP